LHFGHRCLNKKVSLDLAKYFVEDIGDWLGKNQSTKFTFHGIIKEENKMEG